MGDDSAEQMPAKPREEHRWLERLVGEWDTEAEADMGPDRPPETTTGTESVRSLDGLWYLLEAVGEMPGGGKGTSLMTLGYDPAKGRYVGSWIGSMMTHQWVYDGELSEDGTTLVLNTEGPDMSGDGGLVPYREVIEIRNHDHRVMTSAVQGDDGEWNEFLEVHFRRKK